MEHVELYGRKYHLPTRPTVVVCIDGFDPEYLSEGIKAGVLPNLAKWKESGFHVTAQGAFPSLTNPNNMCIITGQPTKVHGVSGNYYLDKKTGQEHMITDSSQMRGTTILEKLSSAGVRVAAITAKDKLRKQINYGLSTSNGAICFSSQLASTATLEEHGIADVPQWMGRKDPPQYSGELSLYVLDVGLKLLQEKRSDLLYLTLSDFVQHKHSPDSEEALQFMQEIDSRLGDLSQYALVAVTGDHGMSAKCLPNGEPNVLFLEDLLNEKFPDAKARVICPISDPFVQHHGSLGGSVRVYLQDTKNIEQIMASLLQEPQVELVVTGAEAAERWEMPLDREGDLMVVSTKEAVIGSRKEKHDLTDLGGHQLRTHGGTTELEVPLIGSVAVHQGVELSRNYDIFDLALNYLPAGLQAGK